MNCITLFLDSLYEDKQVINPPKTSINTGSVAYYAKNNPGKKPKNISNQSINFYTKAAQRLMPKTPPQTKLNKPVV